MPNINLSKRRISCKIIYYGPGLSGKTANLRFLCDQLDREFRGKMSTVAIKGYESLYVDVLPVKLGQVPGFEVVYNLCAVPGPALYNKLRRSALKGADGIVFVADSQPARLPANIDSFDNLRENLQANEMQMGEMPHVIQYNKRDLPGVMPAAELRSNLNPFNAREFESSAITGQGIVSTMRAIVTVVRADIEKQL